MWALIYNRISQPQLFGARQFLGVGGCLILLGIWQHPWPLPTTMITKNYSRNCPVSSAGKGGRGRNTPSWEPHVCKDSAVYKGGKGRDQPQRIHSDRAIGAVGCTELQVRGQSRGGWKTMRLLLAMLWDAKASARGAEKPWMIAKTQWKSEKDVNINLSLFIFPRVILFILSYGSLQGACKEKRGEYYSPHFPDLERVSISLWAPRSLSAVLAKED